MNKFWVITKEVYKKTVKSFGFLAVVLSPLLMIAVIIGIGWFFSRETQEDEVQLAILSEEAFVQEMFESEELPFEVEEEITTLDDAEQALIDEEIEGYLAIDLEEGGIQAEMVHEGSLDQYEPMFREVLTSVQTMMRAQEIGVSEEEIALLNEEVVIEEHLVSVEEGSLTDEEAGNTFIAQGSAYVVCIAIFMFIMTYASIIAEEVANEKGTRIMEIILSSATATQHFFGKLAGVMLIMFTQIALYIVVGFIAYFFLREQAFIQDMLMGIDVVDMLQGLMGYTLIFFFVGVLMYVVLAAFFGSLTTKVEDVSKSVQPLIYISVVGFYIGMFALSAPDNIISIVGSYFPIFTPFVMPFRIAAETVSSTGIWLSIIGTVVTAALITFFSLAFYRSNVLVYSDTNIFGTIKRSWSVMQSNRQAKKMKTDR